MSKIITIDPVTRIEGHAKITIQLDDAGEVADAHFHVTQLRGFEKLVEGRPFHEMPGIMARICGICPVSHLIASSKACDELLAVRIPETAADLRRILNLAQIVQSHALSFFYLSSPDLLLGMDAPPADRNIVGVLAQYPELARGGIRLRKFGQQIIERLAGKRIHPAWVVPGGVSEPLSPEDRDAILDEIPEIRQIALDILTWYKTVVTQFEDEIQHFASFPTMFMGLTTLDGALAMYDGQLRLTDEYGTVVEHDMSPYHDYIGEAAEPWTYLKSPYYLPRGYPDGIFRVGPLARLNMVERCGTPLADDALTEFKSLSVEERWSSFHYHYARLIEILYGIEQIEALLNQPAITDSHVRAVAQPNAREGIGVAEAPRGTLLHHYRIDEQGLITSANLIIATGNNNMAMDRGVLQAAMQYVDGQSLNEGMLNRVEAVIRTFDPCLSCSTHAVGQMPLHIQLLAPDGDVVSEVAR
ncbi:MAG: Ni/Fe hydrogenase subunit alpha [Chloroflexota bacterium]